MNAIEFLKEWCGETGPFSVGAIDPEDTSSDGHDWLTTRDLGEVKKFIDKHAAQQRNLYLQVNLCRPDLGTMRAQRNNVAVALCVHAEIDPPKDIDNAEALAVWQMSKGEELVDDNYWLRVGLPRPTAIVFSGTGFVTMWRLEEPVVLWRGQPLAQDQMLVDVIESRNRAMIETLAADKSSVDVSRLLRLPGTYNIPGESKKKKGRLEAVLAEVIEYEPSRKTALGVLPALAAPTRNENVEIPDFVGAPDPEKLMAAAEFLGENWAPEGSQHHAHLALAGALARAGWPAELIADFAEAVAEINKAGNGKRDKRLKAAETSVAKVHSGVVITGWPSLIEHVSEEVVQETRKLLGFKDPIDYDPEFSTALVEADPSEPPTEAPEQLEFDTQLATREKKWKGSSKPQDAMDGELLRRVRKGKLVVNENDDLTQLTIAALRAVCRAAPKAPTELLTQRFARARPDIPLALLMSMVDKTRDSMAVAVQAARRPDEFAVEDSGPRAGQPIAQSQHNIRVALEKLGVAFRYNLFADVELITRDGLEEIVQDHHVKILRNEIERTFEFRPEKDFLFDTCEVIAREDSFHPILDYIDSLTTEPDEEDMDLAQTWLIRYAGAEDTPYVRAVSQLMLVAAVRRVRQPGCLFQEMLILETPQQGKGKSEGLRALVPDGEWFTDDFALHTDDSKKMLEQTDGKWIIEAAELKGFLRTSDDSVKQYLSRREDQARMAFGRKTRRKKRQFVIFGTINDLEYLKDLTGNRRYWPVRVKQFDVQGIAAIRDKLWAVAAALDLANPEPSYIRLDPSLYAAAAAEQEKRRMLAPVEMRLRDCLEGVTGALLVTEVYKVAGYEDKDPNKTQHQEIVSVLQALGFTRERATVEGKQRDYYMRGETDAERRVRITITGSSIMGYDVKLSQGTHTRVTSTPQGPEIPAN